MDEIVREETRTASKNSARSNMMYLSESMRLQKSGKIVLKNFMSNKEEKLLRMDLEKETRQGKFSDGKNANPGGQM